MPDFVPNPAVFAVRSYCDADAAACRALYTDGLIGGRIADNDTGLDIDDISAAYLATPDGHFWVAQTPAGEIVGTIGVQPSEPGVGEIRRLRVRADYRRRGIGYQLVEAAVLFCRDRGHVKIMLDTYVDREPAIRLFEKLNFLHARTRKIGEKELLYFYLDLYHRDGARQD